MTDFTLVRVRRLTGRIAPVENAPIPMENEIQYRWHYRMASMNRRSLIGILGMVGSGRNTLAFRISKVAENRPFEESEVQRATRYSVLLDISNRRRLATIGYMLLEMRVVPPDVNDEGVAFFSPDGEVTRCNALVFCIDVTDRDSSAYAQQLLITARRCCRSMPPFLFVGNKVDQRYFFAPFRPDVGRRMAYSEGAEGYVECSALHNVQMSRVYNKIMRMLVPL